MGNKKVWLGILLVLVPFPDIQVPYSPIGHIPIFYPWAIFISGYFIWTNPRARLPISTPIFLLLIAAMIISVPFGISKIDLPTDLGFELDIRFTPWRAGLHIGWWLLGFIVVHAVTSIVTTPDRLRTAAKITIIMGGIITATGAYELLARWLDLPYIFLSNVAWDHKPTAVFIIDGIHVPRPSGPFREPKILGQILLLPLLLTLAYTIATNNKKWLLPGLLFAVFIGLAGSTPTIFGAMAGLLTMALISIKYGLVSMRPSRRQIILGTAVVLVLGIALIPLIFPVAAYHFRRIDTAWGLIREADQSITPGIVFRDSTGGLSIASDYIYGWTRGIQIFLDNPVLGVGQGYSPFHMEVWDRVFTPFSVYILLLAEIGIIGFGLFLAFLSQIVKAGIGSMRSLERKFGHLESLIAAALVGALIGDLFTYQSHGGTRFEVHDWMIIGLLLALPRLRRSEDSETG